MVLCFWSQVEKNEEADQEIKQDGAKPEENAHKAATKIQASFRGHITRKKMKDGEKDEENDAAPDESAETEEEEKKERVSPSEEKPVSTETAEESKPAEQPNSPAAEAPPTAAADSAPSDTPAKEEAQEAENTAAENPAHDVNAQKEEKKEEEKKEEAKQADVPDAAESQETDQIDKKGASEKHTLSLSLRVILTKQHVKCEHEGRTLLEIKLLYWHHEESRASIPQKVLYSRYRI